MPCTQSLSEDLSHPISVCPGHRFLGIEKLSGCSRIKYGVPVGIAMPDKVVGGGQRHRSTVNPLVVCSGSESSLAVFASIHQCGLVNDAVHRQTAVVFYRSFAGTALLGLYQDNAARSSCTVDTGRSRIFEHLN